MKEKKNIVASVKDRLRHIAQKEGKSHQILLLRYFQERFLFRLSQSRFVENFCLKGGAFLYIIEGERSRVTKDIDFLGLHLKSSQEVLSRVVMEICRIPYPEDGVTFDFESLSVEDIVKDGSYHGIRISINAHLDRTMQKLQIDIGFGDVVVPRPVKMTYPVILEMDAPVLLAYSIESTIAEKFEAMIDLAEINTRMKDFYDLYNLFKNHDVDPNMLEQAIGQTFQRRGTPSPENHSLFHADFFLDEDRNSRWQAWLRKTGLDMNLSFEEVMGIIAVHLQPIYERLP
jgi:predicted nucleotidyltransferase component of viral defense system